MWGAAKSGAHKAASNNVIPSKTVIIDLTLSLSDSLIKSVERFLLGNYIKKNGKTTLTEWRLTEDF